VARPQRKRPTLPNKLILDTDGGVDDAQALLLLIANGRPPDAITTVFGNVDLQTATYNVLSVLAVAGADIEVHKGAPEPLEEEIVIHAREVHGDDGLGGAPRPHTIAEIAGSDGAGARVTSRSMAATTGTPEISRDAATQSLNGCAMTCPFASTITAWP